LTVPRKVLRTAQTVPKSTSRKIGKITVHGLLAADLSLDSSEARAYWRAVMPTKKDFEESMPFNWDETLQDFLPWGAKALLENQRRKFEKDWMSVTQAFPSISQELYTYNWLIVNTRTFFYVAPGAKQPSSHDDCMALNPFADYFNHAEQGCIVEYGSEGFIITSDRVYDKGEEIYISYGNHSNDFLLAEYGFILPHNKWDEVRLDPIILPALLPEQRSILKDARFLGNYVLDHNNVCYRTQVALRLLCLPIKKWQQFVDGKDDGELEQPQVDKLLVQLLQSYCVKAKGLIGELASLPVGIESQRVALSKRWEQIIEMLQLATKRM
jgi:hypothetical protein